jgi:hypothetical protein
LNSCSLSSTKARLTTLLATPFVVDALLDQSLQITMSNIFRLDE